MYRAVYAGQGTIHFWVTFYVICHENSFGARGTFIHSMSSQCAQREIMYFDLFEIALFRQLHL